MFILSIRFVKQNGGHFSRCRWVDTEYSELDKHSKIDRQRRKMVINCSQKTNPVCDPWYTRKNMCQLCSCGLGPWKVWVYFCGFLPAPDPYYFICWSRSNKHVLSLRTATAVKRRCLLFYTSLVIKIQPKSVRSVSLRVENVIRCCYGIAFDMNIFVHAQKISGIENKSIFSFSTIRGLNTSSTKIRVKNLRF